MKKISWLNMSRWILFLPGATLLGMVAGILIGFGLQVSDYVWGVDSAALFPRFRNAVVTSGFFGAAFVYAGARVAPSGRKGVSYVLTALIMLCAVVISIQSLAEGDWLGLVCGVSIAIGAAMVAYSVVTKSLNLDTDRLLR